MFTHHIALYTQTSIDATQPLRKAVLTNLTTRSSNLSVERMTYDRTCAAQFGTRQFLHTTSLTYTSVDKPAPRYML